MQCTISLLKWTWFLLYYILKNEDWENQHIATYRNVLVTGDSSFVHLLFAVGRSVSMTTNFEQDNNDGPCSNDHIVVTCSVVGSFLRWSITNTSLNISGSNTVIMFANPDDEGKHSVIQTSTITLGFYQNRTVRNSLDVSNSTIEAEMYFQLSTDEFVVVSCTASDQVADERHIIPLGTFFLSIIHVYKTIPYTSKQIT